FGSGRLNLGSPAGGVTVTPTATTTLPGQSLDRVLSWRAGAQTQSLVLRWSAQRGFVRVAVLQPGVNSVRDAAPLTESLICYVLVPFMGDLANNPTLQGISDLVCVYPGTNI